MFQYFYNGMCRDYQIVLNLGDWSLNEIYIDGEFINGRWRYSDGIEMTYFNWYSNQPNGNGNENCVILLKLTDYQWHDADCGSAYPYMCEMF